MSLVMERAPLTVRLLEGPFQHFPKNVQMNKYPCKILLTKRILWSKKFGKCYLCSIFAMISNGHEPSKIYKFYRKQTCYVPFYKFDLNLFDIECFSPPYNYHLLVQLCLIPCQVSVKP